jgi:hypothetical protein
VNVTKLAAVLAAGAITFGAGAVGIPSASAADNIKIFGEQERLNGPNGFPYIGYTVNNFGPSNAPVPHKGKLYSAKLWVDGFGGNHNPQIDRFGARALKGAFYPAIPGASNMNMLYFDVVGPVPNSVVWNDGVRDILAWVPGELPLQGFWEAPPEPEPVATPENSVVISEGGMPAESDPALVATPEAIPVPGVGLEEELASPFRNR